MKQGQGTVSIGGDREQMQPGYVAHRGFAWC